MRPYKSPSILLVFKYFTYNGVCYGNSGIHIFCRQIFRQIKAPILLILVSDPWPGYTFAFCLSFEDISLLSELCSWFTLLSTTVYSAQCPMPEFVALMPCFGLAE
ncbi:hypothetical protein ACN38_g8355 [Penicillium nordicum]|uniref:Uncharacterized protein n=1 Tax=Penicillium nordicum TaxID=229535 RepID=A0A0M9WDJ2_9EURO|nr:hypothetical protein ACN38_g8355 [Penicillium nordicum]